MVEFALALPVLLTLIYGILETGRLLFIYSSTVTAARQAVRYGSATGIGPNGMPYYQDCVGIENAAQNVGFINDFQDILIKYDAGPDGVPIESKDRDCPASSVQNGDRIVVSVSAQWQPIVPIVPLEPFIIRSESARTILYSVSISVTSPAIVLPGGGGGGGPTTGEASLLNVVPSTTTYTAIGEIINFTYYLQNIGTGELIPPTLIDSAASVHCPTDPVPAGNPYTCTGSLTINQGNMDDGEINSVAFLYGQEADAITTILTTTAQAPSLNLAKSATPAATSRVGREIIYTYTLTNTGNVTLSAPFSVTDDKIPVDCSGTVPLLPPGESTTCTGTDVVTEADIDAGTKTNTAIASAVFNLATISSNMDTATVLTPPIILEVFAPVIVTAPGDVIFTIKVTNDTDFPASSVSISNDQITISASCPVFVPANSSITCTGSYTFTQEHIDNGDSLVNTTIVNAVMDAKDVVSNPVTLTVAISQIKQLTAVLTAVPSTTPVTADLPDPTRILYTYALTNTGNVTLKAPFEVTDDKAVITCTDQSDFAPGAPERTCTGEYIVLPEDITAGFIKNTGFAKAIFDNKGTPETVTSEVVTKTVPTFEGPRFDVNISAELAPGNSLPAVILYTYTITNTGNVTLTKGGNFNITTSLPTDTIDCSLAEEFLVTGESTTCTGEYIVTTTGYITNTVTDASTVEAPTANNLPQSATTNVLICNNAQVTLNHSAMPGTSITWTIGNNSGGALTINRILITWPSNRNLLSATFNGSGVWAGSPPGMSNTNYDPNLFNGRIVNNGSNATITLNFQNSTSVSDFTVEFVQPECSSSVFSNP